MSLLKVDLHMHTCVSKDGWLHPVEVIKVAKQKGLDRICITDHNRIDGAVVAYQLEPELGIVGGAGAGCSDPRLPPV